MKCAPNRVFGVITEQNNFNVTQIDGLLGIGRIVPGNNDNKTQFIAGLVNETDPNLIQNFTAFIDVRNNKIHLGTAQPGAYVNQTLNGFLNFKNQKDLNDDGSWAVRIEDVMYGSAVNGTSLEDEFSDLAIIDSMFPGLLIPDRVWGKFNQTFIQTISNDTKVNVTCNQSERIYGVDYSFCYAASSCGSISSNIKDIFLYFNATKGDQQTDKNYTQYILSLKK